MRALDYKILLSLGKVLAVNIGTRILWFPQSYFILSLLFKQLYSKQKKSIKVFPVSVDTELWV